MRLRNPISGTVDDFTEGQAKVRLRNGWVEVEEDPTPHTASRADLDAHARLVGIDPDQYRTKADLAEAIDSQEQ